MTITTINDHSSDTGHAELQTDVKRAVSALDDYKANDITVLDLRKLSGATDFFVIASGSSELHVRSMGSRIVEDLSKQGLAAHHLEGLSAGRWVLLDYIDFVIHIFHPATRDFYQLERLWIDAPAVHVGPHGRRVAGKTHRSAEPN